MNKTLEEQLRKVQELQILNLADVFRIDMRFDFFSVFVRLDTANGLNELNINFNGERELDENFKRKINSIKALLNV